MSEGYAKIGSRYYAQAPEAMTAGREPRPKIFKCPICGLWRAAGHTGSRLCLKAKAKQLQEKEKAA
jgi:hypothetical protein